MESFVAFDLELTPFPGDQQRIIEIAAVRFRDGRPVADFCTLVDPRCDLTPRIGALTGICQREVDAAPPWQQVVSPFLDFVGDEPLVGQSVNLDVDCLSAAGVALPNPLLDTFELASLLLPGLPSYDLGTIARSLGLTVGHEHRALDDALLSGQVFLALLGRIDRLGLPVLGPINSLAAQLPSWPFAGLFRSAQRRQLRRHFAASEPGRTASGLPAGPALRRPAGQAATPLQEQDEGSGAAWGGPRGLDDGAPGSAGWAGAQGLFERDTRPIPRPSLRPAGTVAPVDLGELRALLEPSGPVASALPGYEAREEQDRMMAAVADALNQGEHLLVEAGTGTGKSMAYLLPAIYYAVRNGRRVAISTNTLNLQDQLYHKDIPGLQACLPLEFRAALLKGRANYLCQRRWLALSRSPHLSAEETLLLIKTLVWLSTTDSGDRSELNLSPVESEMWGGISAQVESCAMAACTQFQRGACYVLRARRKAENAHLLVVNHALLLSDVASSGGVLPDYSHLIVDEAHHLEEEATRQMGFTLGCGDLRSFLTVLYQAPPTRRPAGFLPELRGVLRGRRVSPGATEALETLLAAAESDVESALEASTTFFEALHCFLHDHDEGHSRAGARLRITPSLRIQPGWSEMEVRWAELGARLSSLRRHLQQLESVLLDLEEGRLPAREGIVAEMAGFQSYLDRVTAEGEAMISRPSANGIYWVSCGSTADDLSISSAPLHVGEALNASLFSTKDSVVLTSATLTAEGSFDYVKERLGLENARELALGSPFDYRRSTLLYVVQDMPEPARPTSQRAVETTIAHLVQALQGRTLVLFTSHAQLRMTANAIRPRLEQQGILVLAHGVDGSRRRLLQAFVSSPRAVLMGTSSFWEGIDVVGEALSCLIIVKLPFSVPTDPIFAARSEAFEEPFRQYSVPQTILRLKQGFGRLIRSRSDRGIVVILDSRLGSKFYGPAFIHSLPRCTVRLGPAAHVAEAAATWLDGCRQDPSDPGGTVVSAAFRE